MSSKPSTAVVPRSKPCDLTAGSAPLLLRQTAPHDSEFGAQCQRFRVSPQQYAALVEQLGFQKEQGALFGEMQRDGSYVVGYAPNSAGASRAEEPAAGDQSRSPCHPDDAVCDEESALTQQRFLSGALAQRREQCDAVRTYRYQLSQATKGGGAHLASSEAGANSGSGASELNELQGVDSECDRVEAIVAARVDRTVRDYLESAGIEPGMQERMFETMKEWLAPVTGGLDLDGVDRPTGPIDELVDADVHALYNDTKAALVRTCARMQLELGAADPWQGQPLREDAPLAEIFSRFDFLRDQTAVLGPDERSG